MKNKDELKKYFKNKYNNKNENYRIILSEIKKTEKRNINANSNFDFFKMVVTAFITILGTTSVVLASTKIYEYIKGKDELNSDKLYINEEGLYSMKFAENMKYDESVDLYYKIISNIDDFNKYKEDINELPEMKKEDFDNSFLIIVGNWGARNPHESDLMISSVNVDEKTTYITMKQKEDAQDNKCFITVYAIIDKEFLRDTIKLSIEAPKISYENFEDIEKLPNNYSIEDALNDGCFVEEDSKVLSENEKALDELIENSKSGKKAFLRIYSKNCNHVRIIDLQYDDGMFFLKVRASNDLDIYTFSFKYLTKKEEPKEKKYVYGYNSVDRAIDAGLLVEISY